MAHLAKLRNLSAPQWRELLLALVLLPTIELALRMGGLRLVQKAIAPDTRCGVVAGPWDVRDALQLARLVAAAARRGPWRASCLVRSLALQCLLKRRGADSQLRLGVRMAGRRLEAHAWVELLGRPLNEPANVSQNFAPFEPFPSSKR